MAHFPIADHLSNLGLMTKFSLKACNHNALQGQTLASKYLQNNIDKHEAILREKDNHTTYGYTSRAEAERALQSLKTQKGKTDKAIKKIEDRTKEFNEPKLEKSRFRKIWISFKNVLTSWRNVLSTLFHLRNLNVKALTDPRDILQAKVTA